VNDPRPPESNVTERPTDGRYREGTERPTWLAERPEALTFTVPSAPYGSSYVVSVFGDELLVSWLHPRKREPQRWSRDQLESVRHTPDPSGDGPTTYLVEIQPHPGEGRKVALPLWEEADARRLTDTLRQALRIPDPQPGQLPPFRERTEQPAGSKITLERSADGVVLTVPPAGWRHPNVRWMFLAGAGVSAMALAGYGLISWLAAVTSELWAPGDSPVRGFALLWVVVFGLLALLGLTEAVWRARRHALLAVADDTLTLNYTTLPGTWRWRWERRLVMDVRIGRSWCELEEANCNLQVHLKSGKVVRVLVGYGDPELQWVATMVRRALRVPRDPLAGTAPVERTAFRL
jgi:hypothetical protein